MTDPLHGNTENVSRALRGARASLSTTINSKILHQNQTTFSWPFFSQEVCSQTVGPRILWDVTVGPVVPLLRHAASLPLGIPPTPANPHSALQLRAFEWLPRELQNDLQPPPPPPPQTKHLQSTFRPWHCGAFYLSRGGGRDALEGNGPQRRPQRRLDRRLEEVAKAVGGAYCWLQKKKPLRLALAVRGTVAGHRLEGGGGGTSPPSNASRGGGGCFTFSHPQDLWEGAHHHI